MGFQKGTNALCVGGVAATPLEPSTRPMALTSLRLVELRQQFRYILSLGMWTVHPVFSKGSADASSLPWVDSWYGIAGMG